jgi:hypothetical protein
MGDRIGLDPNLYGDRHYNNPRGGGRGGHGGRAPRAPRAPRVPSTSTRSQGPGGGNMSRAFSASLESDVTSTAGYTLSGAYDHQQSQQTEMAARQLTQGKVSS